MARNRPRIGVVGVGWWASYCHIPSLLSYDGVELVALADHDGDKVRAAGDRYGIARVFDDPEALYASGLIDGVVIAVPHAHHYSLARAALDHGLHVLVEKPMTLYAHQAWDLVHRAAEHGLHLMVGYTYQFVRTAQHCREIAQSGRLGEIVQVSGLFASVVEAHYRGEPGESPPRHGFPVTRALTATYSDPHISGGGQAQTQLTHAIGMVLWVTDQAAIEVMAYMDNRDLAVDVVDAIAYRLRGRAVGTMGSTGMLRDGQPKQQELRYYGTRGLILQDLSRGTVEAHFNGGTNEVASLARQEDAYPAEEPARRFADLVAGRSENPAPPVPAARTVEFLEASYRSARLGRPVGIDELQSQEIREPWS